MELDLQSPYDIDEEASLDYTFVNRDGIKYHASFYSVEPLYPEFVDTYSFSIEPEDKKVHPMDRRIAITIAEILKRFFKVNTNAMIMVCDSTDGKELKRRKLFDRWFVSLFFGHSGHTFYRTILQKTGTCASFLKYNYSNILGCKRKSNKLINKIPVSL